MGSGRPPFLLPPYSQPPKLAGRSCSTEEAQDVLSSQLSPLPPTPTSR